MRNAREREGGRGGGGAFQKHVGISGTLRPDQRHENLVRPPCPCRPTTFSPLPISSYKNLIRPVVSARSFYSHAFTPVSRSRKYGSQIIRFFDTCSFISEYISRYYFTRLLAFDIN